MDSKYKDNSQYKVWDYWDDKENNIFYIILLDLDKNQLILVEGNSNGK
jgi:hypothetical protein